MEKMVFLEKRKKSKELYEVLVTVISFLLLCPIASSLNDEGTFYCLPGGLVGECSFGAGQIISPPFLEIIVAFCSSNL